MKLNRLDPVNQLTIFAPRWRDRVVLLADWKIGTHNRIDIKSKGADGHPHYPSPMYVSGAKAKSYPVESVKGFKMRPVPLAELEAMEEQDDEF